MREGLCVVSIKYEDDKILLPKMLVFCTCETPFLIAVEVEVRGIKFEGKMKGWVFDAVASSFQKICKRQVYIHSPGPSSRRAASHPPLSS
jgi:hypothetical protein